MKKKLQFICILPLLMLSIKNEVTIIGTKQKDEKCNTLAGYQWSTIKLQLKSVAIESIETFCAVIFNNTNDQVEVFTASKVILA